MPKEPFFNLTEEKKEGIIEAMMDEFAARLYLEALVMAIAWNC